MECDGGFEFFGPSDPGSSAAGNTYSQAGWSGGRGGVQGRRAVSNPSFAKPCTEMDLATGGASVPWAELPADALSEIAGHLRDAGDLVRFLAVCRPWRGAPPPPRAPSFLPCLVEPSGVFDDPGVGLHTPLSARKTRFLLPLPALRGKKVERSDASGGRVLAVSCSDGTRAAELINPLNGDATSLPPPPRRIWPESRSASSGVVSRSGAVVLHANPHLNLAAVLLRPGELVWEEVSVTFSVWARGVVDTRFMDEQDRVAAALCSSTVLPGAAACATAKLPRQPPRSHRYLLEFRGELLCVDVVMRLPFHYKQVVLESVSVHRMQVGDEGRPRWVESDHGRGDTDHLCFFLSSRGSFAVDAREYAGSAEVTGGCAFFCSWHPTITLVRRFYVVYKYSFRNGKVTVVAELHTFFDKLPMWFIPRPRMPPAPLGP
ncbi:hypothetical protein PVAP13_4KG214600 [Panicum virgatum]|uniref:KIB1-4 beta-propeller domain-containing protein n=1 Tax=Panicum virgatum TaxID=38727 RepID=A0A8T0TNT3_PANVG|nr:hypothetical protein PVAP13_4KG214600 [Panicum virgatum]